MEGDNGDEDRKELVNAIMCILTKESPTKKIQREVEMLSDIKAYKRKTTETPDVFVIRYKTCIDRYKNQ